MMGMGCFFHDPGDEIYHLTVFSDREIGAIFRYQVFSGWINQPNDSNYGELDIETWTVKLARSPATCSRKIFGKYPGRPLENIILFVSGWMKHTKNIEKLRPNYWLVYLRWPIPSFVFVGYPTLVLFFVGSIPLFHSGFFKSTYDT